MQDEVAYDFMTVKAIRGREAATTVKWQDQGWELLSQDRGTLRSELRFRRVKPKSFGARVAEGYAVFRGLSPRTQAAALTGVALLVVLGIGGVAVGVRGSAESGPSTAEPVTAEPSPAESERGSVPAETPQPRAAVTTPPEEPGATPVEQTVEPTVSEATVDELVDKINSADLGGMSVGDRFRVTGELVGADMWSTGASGDFFVTLATASGSDLIVFVEESATEQWQNGTIVEMVLENVEVTINGETSDGWFEAVSTTVVSS